MPDRRSCLRCGVKAGTGCMAELLWRDSVTHIGVGGKQRLRVTGKARPGRMNVLASGGWIDGGIAVEATGKDGLDGAIERTAVCQGTVAGGLQAWCAVRALQTQ